MGGLVLGQRFCLFCITGSIRVTPRPSLTPLVVQSPDNKSLLLLSIAGGLQLDFLISDMRSSAVSNCNFQEMASDPRSNLAIQLYPLARLL